MNAGLTDTSEKGLERLICTALTGSPCDPGAGPAESVRERPAIYDAGWIGGAPEDYDREYCVDLAQLSTFLRETQPEAAEALGLGQDGQSRRKFLARLQGEITKRGTIDVLRHCETPKQWAWMVSHESVTLTRKPANALRQSWNAPVARERSGSAVKMGRPPTASPWTCPALTLTSLAIEIVALVREARRKP